MVKNIVIERGIYRVEHYNDIGITSRIEGEVVFLENRVRDICSTEYPYTRCTCREYTIKWEVGGQSEEAGTGEVYFWCAALERAHQLERCSRESYVRICSRTRCRLHLLAIQ